MRVVGLKEKWHAFYDRHPKGAQFFVFFLMSNIATFYQLILMPLLKAAFEQTTLVATSFQVWPISHNPDGSIYYIFDYAAGSIAKGGGGGLAYFLAVEVTLFTAQILNFFLQRKVTFKSRTSIPRAAMWYFIAWVLISLGASALQGLYKTPLYHLFISWWGSTTGTTLADFTTMQINAWLSFLVFFPIMRWIFKEKKEVLK